MLPAIPALVQAAIPAVANIIDKLIPDPEAQAKAKLELLALAQKGDLAELDAFTRIALAQADVNKAEAQSPSLFKGGWRPATAWTCNAGLAYAFLAKPILPWILTVAGVPDVPPLPDVDVGTLIAMLVGMLGLGGLRTKERLEGKIPEGR